MHSFIFSASFEFAFAAILFVFHQSQDLVPRSSHSLSWPPFWINFHSPWTNQSRDFCCVPGSSLLPPPYWKTRRPWGRGCVFYLLNCTVNHSFNNEWNLGPRRNQDGGWRTCLLEAWTFKCLHRLSRTSLPRLKRLTICWLICSRLAYFYEWKCATYATGKQRNVCWPRCKIEGRLSSSPEFDETL